MGEKDDVLSEGELDALMDSVSSGDVPLDATAGDGYQPFDFSTREQAMLAQMPGLATINEKHALGFSQGIEELFRLPVEVTPRDVRLLPLSEALVAIPDPAVINLIRTEPLPGISYVICPGEMLSFFIDHYFGGASTVNKGRPSSLELTPTEYRINEVLATRFLLTLQSAWSGLVAMTPHQESTETNPEFLRLEDPDQLALAFGFELKVEDWAATIEWLLAYRAIEPLRESLAGPAAAEETRDSDPTWTNSLKAELPEVEIELSAVFAESQVSISDVLGLRMGSVVPLEMPSEVTLQADNLTLGSGEYGAFNGRKAVKIRRLFTGR